MVEGLRLAVGIDDGVPGDGLGMWSINGGVGRRIDGHDLEEQLRRALLCLVGRLPTRVRIEYNVGVFFFLWRLVAS